MTASLSDILTTQKNGVVAINNLSQILQGIATNIGTITAFIGSNAPTNSSPTVVATTYQAVVGKGVLFSVSIPASSGSNQVLIYDSATTGGISSSNLIYASLAANAANFVPYRDVRIHYSNGLVVVAQTSMSCVVSYTPNI